MKFILFFALFFVGCGTPVDPKSPKFLYTGVLNKKIPNYYIDPLLSDIWNEFIYEAESYGLDTKQIRSLRRLEFVDGLHEGVSPYLDDTVRESIGECMVADETNELNNKVIRTHRFVIFDSLLRDTMEHPLFKAIAYHEFFHCGFNLGHTDSGIMAPRLQTGAHYWDENFDEQKHEIFESLK